MTSPVSAIETIAKAMEVVTPGPWQHVQIGHGSRVKPDIAWCGHTSSQSHAETEANAAYIAACNPVAMREVLDELYALRKTVLQLEAMQREVAALLDAEALSGIRALVAGWNGEHLPEKERFGRHHDELGVKLPTTCGAIYALDEAMTRARTLIQGEKNA